MDYLGEIVALGIDSIIFGICLKQYFHCKNAITAVKVNHVYFYYYYWIPNFVTNKVCYTLHMIT